MTTKERVDVIYGALASLYKDEDPILTTQMRAELLKAGVSVKQVKISLEMQEMEDGPEKGELKKTLGLEE